MNSERNHAIDGIRALSVAAVLAYHLELPVFGGGFLGVEVFFVISGSLITSLLLAEHRRSGKIDLKRFWLRRFRRLLPAVLALLVFISVLIPVFAADASVSFRRDAIGALLYISNWWQLWFGQSYFEAALRPPLLRHLWSLAVEEQFYVLWPIAMIGLVRLRRNAAIGVLAVGATVSALIMWLLQRHSLDSTRAYLGTDSRAFGLLVGAIFALAVSTYPKLLAWPAAAATAVGVTGLGGIAWSTWSLSSETKWLFPFGFLVVDATTVAVLLAVSSHREKWLSTALGNPVLRWLGTRSYGLYLFHFPIFQMMRPRVDLANHWWVNPLRVGLSVIMAELSYRLIETPFRVHGIDGLRKRLGRRAVPALLVSASLIAFGTVGLWTANPTVGSEAATDAESSAIVLDPARRQASDSRFPNSRSPESTLQDSSAPTTFHSNDPSGTDRTPNDTIAVGTIPVGVAAAPTYPPLSTIPVASIPGDQPTTTVALEPARIIALGDSVMLGAGRQLNRAFGQQLELDAVESRSWFKAPEELLRYDVVNNPPKVLILHLGNNGAPEDSTIKQVLKLSERIPVVVVITVALPRRWESETNKRLNAIAKLRPDVRIADWHTFSAGQRGWFERDGFHLNEPGRFAYTEMLRVVLADSVPSVRATSAASASPTTSTTSTTTTPTSPSTSTSTSTVPVPSTSVQPPTVPPTTSKVKGKSTASTPPSTVPATAPPSVSVPPVTSRPPAPETLPPPPSALPPEPAPTIPAAG